MSKDFNRVCAALVPVARTLLQQKISYPDCPYQLLWKTRNSQLKEAR